jgi:transposase-like protein
MSKKQSNDKDQALFDVSRVTERLKGIKSLDELTGSGGILQEMIKSTVERILKGEQEQHLGFEPYKKQDTHSDNSRNGFSKKTLKTSDPD